MKFIFDILKKRVKLFLRLPKKYRQIRMRLCYAKYYKYCSIREKTVFYQAYRNKIMGGNPYAIFKELMENPQYKDYTHIWAYESEDSLQDNTFQRYKNHDNVTYVKSTTKEYYKALATCQFLVNNAALPSYWSKRKGQTYINTWHGTPLKTLGRRAGDRSIQSISNAQRNFFLCDYMVMPNRYTIEKMLDAYDLKNILPGKILDAGYPRVDLVLKTDGNYIRSLLEEKLGVPLKEKKLVLYAPTFRSNQGKSANTSDFLGRYMEEMVQMLPPDYELVFKVHNMIAVYFRDNQKMKSRLIFDDIETNELLSAIDVLITDYSSIFFEFLCTRKPIIFFTYDREEYEGGRGLYRPLEELPGAMCDTVEEVTECIRQIDQGTYAHRDKLQSYIDEFAYHDDGMASRRVTDIIFGGETSQKQYLFQEEHKKNILVLADNILTAEDKYTCFSALRPLDYSSNSVMVLAKNVFSFDEEFEQKNPQIKLNASTPTYLSTLFEKICYKAFHKVPGTKRFYQRQFDKYFGNIQFSQVIDVSKGTSHWTQLLKSQDLEYHTVRRNSRADLKTLREEAGHVLTVLIMGAFDSSNYVFVNLIKEIKKRGYRSIVVVNDPDDYVNNKMFIENNISLTATENFDYALLTEVDFAISAPFMKGKMRKLWKSIEARRIFCISFANLFSSIVMRVYTDLIFTIGNNKFKEFEDNGFHYSMIAAGNPQYDDLVVHKSPEGEKEGKEIKRVLFVDQGGYPFGKEGKALLGQVLTAMASYHPQMEFVVKPRFLPEDQGQVLHQPSEHLYDFIQNPPANLILLREPSLLEDIMKEFDAMVTMWSTAYLDAALMGMPLMLIQGLPSEEVFDVRGQRIQEAYDQLEYTGCVMNYREVLKGNLTFNHVAEDYLEKEVGDRFHPCAPKVVDTLEVLYKHLIVPGKRLEETIQMDIDTFAQKLPQLKKINVWSNVYAQRREFRKHLNAKMQALAFDNRCMEKPFDLDPLKKYWDYSPKENMKKCQLALQKAKVNAAARNVRKKYFTASNMAAETDFIRLDSYFDWLFREGRYNAILGCQNPNVLPETRAFYKAMICLRKHKMKDAAKEFSSYCHEIENRQVKSIRKARNPDYSYFPKGMACMGFFEALYEIKEFEIIKQLGDATPFDIYLRTYYLLKVLEEEKCYEELTERYQSFIIKAKPLQRPKDQAQEAVKLQYQFYMGCKSLAENYKQLRKEENYHD